jgi:hypothetical protein
MPGDTLRENEKDATDQATVDETAESMHRATERLRGLWMKMNKFREPTAAIEESKSEDVK